MDQNLSDLVVRVSRANKIGSKYAELARPMTSHELFVLGAIDKLPISSFSAILRHALSKGYPLTDVALCRALLFLKVQELVFKEGRLCSIRFVDCISREYYNYTVSVIQDVDDCKPEIQLVDYIPEVSRYGGALNIAVCEKHFESSSRVVLSIISKAEQWNYNLALGFAIKLQFAFIHASKLNAEEKKVLLRETILQWIHTIYSQQDKVSLNQEDISNVDRIFEKALDSSRLAI